MRVIDHLDTPAQFDCSAYAIPGAGSAPIQVVASLASGCSRVKVRDGIGNEFYGLYVGPVGAEVFQFECGGVPVEEIDCDIPAGARISLRSMDADAITRGILSMNFQTYGGTRG